MYMYIFYMYIYYMYIIHIKLTVFATMVYNILKSHYECIFKFKLTE